MSPIIGWDPGKAQQRCVGKGGGGGYLGREREKGSDANTGMGGTRGEVKEDAQVEDQRGKADERRA